ncbi:HrpE/YscL family type III secretion apparatus protein [Marinomonas mediterranea]|jgi:HrpE protein.|uniref:Type III secretion apparatus protein, HrpE/YscL family n=1 Tax=Marinomonas mediterranea (strain ATCC 700492 / JCM 21426 / NBRC 103028 / MMB-1) TaxID=717774 RepID=F2JTE6_MARM1|nr:HrpE/YscL family type III secretion apparatus protein [Marinomonas mediterranea]ADZ90364.1 hypothetical protein Marme_1089 [Marinomonas mediterranea MMB-1]WCN16546.1 hypothetical protein GV053_05510 [Marinomonas mediterranea MMB-1]
MNHFVKHSISLDSYSLDRNLISRKDTENLSRSKDIIAEAEEQAQREAERIIQSAQEEARQIIEQAETHAQAQMHNMKERIEIEAWESIQCLLEEIKRESHLVWDEIEQHANFVVNNVLSRVLSTMSSGEKIATLVAKTVTMHRDKSPATLYCSPVVLTEVEAALQTDMTELINVSADATMQEDEIKLVSGMGEFYANWQTIKKAVVGDDSEFLDSESLNSTGVDSAELSSTVVDNTELDRTGG